MGPKVFEPLQFYCIIFYDQVEQRVKSFENNNGFELNYKGDDTADLLT